MKAETRAVCPRRLVALWDGASFRPVVTPGEFEPGERVILVVSPVRETHELAGKFGSFVGTLSTEEAAEMQDELDRAFEWVATDGVPG